MPKSESKKLTSVAVGGPAAGQSLTGSYGTARYHVLQPLNFTYGTEIPDEITTIGYAYYREMSLRWSDGKDKSFQELKFWVHIETIKDEFELMKELASGYRPVFQDNSGKA